MRNCLNRSLTDALNSSGIANVPVVLYIWWVRLLGYWVIGFLLV